MYGTPEQMADTMLNAAKYAVELGRSMEDYTPACQIAMIALKQGKSDEEARNAALKYIKEHGGVE